MTDTSIADRIEELADQLYEPGFQRHVHCNELQSIAADLRAHTARLPSDVGDVLLRLRGTVRIPITDGLGPVDGQDGFFERQFPTSKLAMEAADTIEALSLRITELTAERDRARAEHQSHMERCVPLLNAYRDPMRKCQQLLCPGFPDCGDNVADDDKECECGFIGGPNANSVPRNRAAKALEAENAVLVQDVAAFIRAEHHNSGYEPSISVYNRAHARLQDIAESAPNERASRMVAVIEAAKAAVPTWQTFHEGDDAYDTEYNALIGKMDALQDALTRLDTEGE